MKTLEATGKTYEEALMAGLAQMGLPSDKVDVEVLEEGSKGFLGIGAKPYRLRLTKKDTPALRAEEFLQNVTELMGLDVVLDVQDEEEALRIEMQGDNQGILIGHRGETLDALRYLLGTEVDAMVASREQIDAVLDRYYRVGADSVEGYLQELTDGFLDELVAAGLYELLPYYVISDEASAISNGGRNGIWTLAPMDDVSGNLLPIETSSMPAGTVEIGGLAVRVVTVPEGKDPDEFIKAKGAEAFRALIEDSENGMEFRLQRAAEGFDLESDDGKVGYLKEAASVIATLPDSVSREVYAMRVAAQCSVSADAVLDAVRQVRRRRQRLNDRQREREDTRPLRQSQPVGVAIKFENPASAKAEMGVIRLLNQSPELFRGDIGLDGADFSSPELRHIYEAMRDLSRQGLETSAASLGAALTPDEVGLYTRIIQEPVSAANGAKALADYIHKIESESHPPDVNDLRAVAEKMKQTKGYGG